MAYAIRPDKIDGFLASAGFAFQLTDLAFLKWRSASDQDFALF
jgi:hypothetical protein